MDIQQFYSVSTFRTLGTGSTTQNLFTLENPNGSSICVCIKYLALWSDSTAALATVSPQVRLSRPASLPTGGTVLTSVKSHLSMASPTTVCRGGTASDGGTATAITATAGTVFYSAFIRRLHTAVGLIDHGPVVLVGDAIRFNQNVLLKANQSLLLQLTTAAANTTHIFVDAIFDEVDFNPGT